MLQIYCGDGKGKTTAAVGAAVRALGAGMRVLFVQFLKNGDSSEISQLKRLGAVCRFPEEKFRLFEPITAEVRRRLSDSYRNFAADILNSAGNFDMIVLDEALGALSLGLITYDCIKPLINCGAELILTGRNAPEELSAAADYISEIKAVRHPFDKGINARRGIEY